jgi:hypothetical protein
MREGAAPSPTVLETPQYDVESTKPASPFPRLPERPCRVEGSGRFLGRGRSARGEGVLHEGSRRGRGDPRRQWISQDAHPGHCPVSHRRSRHIVLPRRRHLRAQDALGETPGHEHGIAGGVVDDESGQAGARAAYCRQYCPSCGAHARLARAPVGLPIRGGCRSSRA